MYRRQFIKNTMFTSGSLLSGGLGLNDLIANTPVERLVILHTNDVHSRLDPFPMDGGRNQGLGGVAARASLINSIRSANEQVLLLDAGDIFQGTPYFNIYNGEPEIKAMTAMKYDACTMGNHDFDAGIENFALQMQKASFPCIISNYDFTNTPLEDKTIPYHVMRKGSLKIGLFGLGIKLKGLVPENLSGGTIYLDPIEKANEMAAFLKKEKKCDFIICLSHLGYKYREPNQISDVVLASETRNIDLIIGGHTHTFMDEPTVIKDKSGEEVIINQVGWAGIRLGRLDFEFNGIKKKKMIKSHTVVISKKTFN